MRNLTRSDAEDYSFGAVRGDAVQSRASRAKGWIAVLHTCAGRTGRMRTCREGERGSVARRATRRIARSIVRSTVSVAAGDCWTNVWFCGCLVGLTVGGNGEIVRWSLDGKA